MNAVFTFSSGLSLLCVFLGQWVDTCSGQRLEIEETLHRQQIAPESSWRCRRHPDSAKHRTSTAQSLVTPSARSHHRHPHPSAHLRKATMPCACEGIICTCCVESNAEKKDCVKFEMPSRRLSKRYKYDFSLRAPGNQTAPSGFSPGPFCITLSKSLAIKICVEFTNVYVRDYVFNICISFKSIFGQKTVAEMAIDCFKFKVFPEDHKAATTKSPDRKSNSNDEETTTPELDGEDSWM